MKRDELECADILTEEERKELSEMPRRKDETITMKCIHCGHEEEMPVDVYGEEAEYLIDIGDTSHPAFQCPKCHKDTLYRKRYYSELTRHN